MSVRSGSNFLHRFSTSFPYCHSDAERPKEDHLISELDWDLGISNLEIFDCYPVKVLNRTALAYDGIPGYPFAAKSELWNPDFQNSRQELLGS
jgi:hypothetical protein